MIGRRPYAAFGNSIGDKQMLEYTQGGGGARLMMLVYHDDGKREYAYGPKSKVGTFTDALMAQAKKNGWVVISMKNDPSTRATASGRRPSLGMRSRGKGSLRGVALSGAQRSRRETKWVPRALPGGTHWKRIFAWE